MEYYTWILTFHIMAMMSWMAMLFYLPRLFVYHVEHKEKKEFVDVVQIQEMKIYKYIGYPAMWATLLSGALMLYLNASVFQEGGWIHAKILVVIFLVIYSLSLDYYRKELLKGNYEKSGRFFRAYNEVPTLLALLIVGYVITKTFSFLFTIISIAVFAFIIYKIMNPKKES